MTTECVQTGPSVCVCVCALWVDTCWPPDSPSYRRVSQRRPQVEKKRAEGGEEEIKKSLLLLRLIRVPVTKARSTKAVGGVVVVVVVGARPHAAKVTVIPGEKRGEGMATGSGEEEPAEEKAKKEGVGGGEERAESSPHSGAGGGGGVGRSSASSFALGAGALARRFLLLVLTHGVSVAHDHLVHPGERLREEHRPLEEAQVAAVQRQGKDGVGLFR